MLITEEQSTTIIIISNESILLLDIMYTCSKPHSGLKLKMIRSLRIMGILSNGKPYPQKQAKHFIEKNYIFEANPSYKIGDQS